MLQNSLRSPRIEDNLKAHFLNILHNQMEPEVDDGLDFPEILDITNDDVNFDEMEHDIERFASEPSVRQVLEVGVDLQNYSSTIRQELEVAEAASIEDYLRQATRVKKLHDEISTCSSALEAMEDLLMEFKSSLGQLSSDICSLQTRSQSITVKLQNRKNLEKYLGEFTREVSLTREFIEQIANGDVGLSYVKLLDELSGKLKFVNRSDVKGSQAAQESLVPLDRLRVRAADNVRKWIVANVNSLRDGEGDRLSIQNIMMRCRSLFRFLRENAPDVGDSARDYYVDQVSKTYLDMYRNATRRITKQMAQISMSPETIVPMTQKTGLFKSKRTIVGESTLFFSLGERAKLLNEMLAPPQQCMEDSYPVEVLLRSLYQCLIDDVTSEHAFAGEFFGDESVTGGIFAPATRYMEQFFDELLAKITDPVCVILLLRFAYAHKAEMEKRKVFNIDQHLTTVQHKLADRFRGIIEMNQQAIESADAKMFLENKDTSYHANAMTRRFSEFATSMSLLMSDEVADIMTPQLHMIGAAVIDLLERTSREFKRPELAVVFLINNYYLILSTLKTINGCVLLELFEQKLNDCTAHFVDLELHTNYKKLVETVRRAFTKLETREDPIQIDIGEAELKEIALDFKQTHVDKMKNIAESQIMKFDDFLNGREILKLVAKRLVLYWAKFDQLCRSAVKNGPAPPWFANLISTQQLVCNIRPMTESF